MEFPKDHNWHDNVGYEWFYLWGRKDNGNFYHHAEFKKNGIVFTHCSEDGEFIEKLIDKPSDHRAKGKLAQRVVIHNKKTGNYYSIPGNPWLDHEWGQKVGGNWIWLAVNLDCGISIMACEKDEERLCDISLNGTTFESDFIIDGKHFFLHRTGMYLTLEPLQDEKIFRPKYGRPYSETPFNVISKGGIIGYGMREKTYKE